MSVLRWILRPGSFLLCVILLVVLQGMGQFGWISPFILPPPVEMFAAIPSLFAEENLFGKFFLTLGTIFLAVVIAVVVGVPIGWLLFRRQAFGQAYESWLGAVFSAPLILLYPLFMVVFGRNVLTILVIGIITGVIPVILHTLQGLRAVPQVFLCVGQSLDMSERQLVFKVLIPAALPTIFVGIRLAIIYCMIYVVALEFLIGIGGIGFTVGDLYARYNIPGMYGAIIFVVLMSVLLFAGTEKIERWLKSH